MQLRIRRRDRAVTAAHYQHLGEMLWCELELLPSRETWPFCKVAMRGDQNSYEEGRLKRLC